jgi:peptidoglycan/LPS O-acetylase OafA/YrhL
MLTILSFVSLAAAQWGATAAPTTNFYLLPSRGWELLAGALVAFYFADRDQVPLTRRLREAGGWLGLHFISCAVFGFDSETPYPSFFTLVPVMGAVLIILFAATDTKAGKILSSKPLTGVGMISAGTTLTAVRTVFLLEPILAVEAIQADPVLNGRTLTTILLGQVTTACSLADVVPDNLELEPLIVLRHEKTQKVGVQLLGFSSLVRGFFVLA